MPLLYAPLVRVRVLDISPFAVNGKQISLQRMVRIKHTKVNYKKSLHLVTFAREKVELTFFKKIRITYRRRGIELLQMINGDD